MEFVLSAQNTYKNYKINDYLNNVYFSSHPLQRAVNNYSQPSQNGRPSILSHKLRDAVMSTANGGNTESALSILNRRHWKMRGVGGSLDTLFSTELHTVSPHTHTQIYIYIPFNYMWNREFVL